MVFPIVGGDGKPTGYEIENSGRFDNAGGSALGTTFGTATNSKKFTLSFWYKISSGTISGGRTLFGGRSGYENIFIHEDTIRQDWNNASSGTVNWAPFVRDQSAWYHFVIAQDTSQSTDSNRVKFYINGVQAGIRSGVNLSYPAQNLESGYNVSGVDFFLSSYNGTAAEVNGYYADVYFVDGQQYAPTVFGETDDNGVWIPKEAKDDVSFGNNGFFLEFKQTGTGTNSSGIGADTSGNDNHLSVAGLAAQDITTDTPTNNFATMNPLSPTQGNPVYAEGNLKISASGTDAYSYFPSTFGLSNGKWYAEVKVNLQGGNTFIGIAETSMEAYYTGADNDPHLTAGTIWYANGGNGYYDGSSQDASTFGAASFTSGDIIGLALDLDSGTKTIKFYKNNTLTATKNLTSNFVDPIVFAANLYNTQNQSWNFGNPPFSISSGNADANGYGNFEYAPPSGYYACCTKNLAEFG